MWPAMAPSKSVGIDLVDMAEATRHGGDVHRGVAAADDHHAVADGLQAAVVEGLEEGGRGHDVGRGMVGRVAGERQGTAGLGAEAEEDRVVAGTQLFQGDIGADAGLEVHFDAEVEDALDFGVERVARRAVAGDAVAHHAAEEFVLVEDGAAVALERQVVGRREAGRAAADDGDLLAGLVFRGLELEIVLDRPVAQVMLDRIDADMVLDLVAVAAGFAGRGQTRPITAGSGLASVRRRQAYSCQVMARLAVGADRAAFRCRARC
jgi:hypothetical protein